MAGEVSIVAIVKGEERFVFMFDDDSRSETLRTFGRYASNPELSFSWYDAAVLSQKVRQTPKSNAENETVSLDRNQPHLPGTDPHFNADGFDFDFTSPDDFWIDDAIQ